jgi:hypothetical protein
VAISTFYDARELQAGQDFQSRFEQEIHRGTLLATMRRRSGSLAPVADRASNRAAPRRSAFRSKNAARCMATIEREFYRSTRGPAPTNEDSWRLVFDPRAAPLLVRHEWEAAGHNGVDEFETAEFLAQDGAAPAELIKILFGRVPADALRDGRGRSTPPTPSSTPSASPSEPPPSR